MGIMVGIAVCVGNKRAVAAAPSEVEPTGIMTFADPAMQALCAKTWGDGTNITYEQAREVTTIPSNWAKGNKTITSFNEIKYFKNCTSIGEAAFSGCSSLNGIILPPSIITIRMNVFSGCTSLKKINLENIKILEGYNFVSALDGTEVRMPKLSSIKSNQAFYRSGVTVLDFTGSTFPATKDSFADSSSRLTKVILPDTITYIGWVAFSGCKSLKTFIVLASTPPSLQSDTFMSTNSTFFIYVPDESVEAYKTATNWTAYANRILPLSQYNG